MKKHLYIEILIILIILFLILTACTETQPEPIKPDSFTWEQFDYDQFQMYMIENQQDFIDVYNVLNRKSSNVQLTLEKTGYDLEEPDNKIIWMDKGPIEQIFSEEEVNIIKKTFEKHRILTVSVYDSRARYQSPHVEGGYYFFTYYESLGAEQKHYANLIDNWGFSSMGD